MTRTFAHCVSMYNMNKPRLFRELSNISVLFFSGNEDPNEYFEKESWSFMRGKFNSYKCFGSLCNTITYVCVLLLSPSRMYLL